MIKTLTHKALAIVALGILTTQATVAQSTLANPLTDTQAVDIAMALTADNPTSEVLFVKTKFYTYGADLNTQNDTLTDTTFVVGTGSRFIAQSEPIAKAIAQGDMTDFTTDWTLEGQFVRSENGEVRFNVNKLYNAIFLNIKEYAGLYLHAGYIIPEGLEVSGITGSGNAKSQGLYFGWNTTGLIVPQATATIIHTTTPGKYALTLSNEKGTAKFLSSVLRGTGIVGENAGITKRYTYAFVNTADSLGLVRVSTELQAPITLYTPYDIYARILETNITQFFNNYEHKNDSALIDLNKSTIDYIQFKRTTTTSISSATLQTTNSNAIYDLHGRQVGTTATFDALPRGLYIIGGKKVAK